MVAQQHCHPSVPHCPPYTAVSLYTVMLVSSAFFLITPSPVPQKTSFHTISFYPHAPPQPVTHHGASFILGPAPGAHVSQACMGEVWTTQG